MAGMSEGVRRVGRVVWVVPELNDVPECQVLSCQQLWGSELWDVNILSINMAVNRTNLHYTWQLLQWFCGLPAVYLPFQPYRHGKGKQLSVHDRLCLISKVFEDPESRFAKRAALLNPLWEICLIRGLSIWPGLSQWDISNMAPTLGPQSSVIWVSTSN